MLPLDFFGDASELRAITERSASECGADKRLTITLDHFLDATGIHPKHVHLSMATGVSLFASLRYLMGGVFGAWDFEAPDPLLQFDSLVPGWFHWVSCAVAFVGSCVWLKVYTTRGDVKILAYPQIAAIFFLVAAAITQDVAFYMVSRIVAVFLLSSGITVPLAYLFSLMPPRKRAKIFSGVFFTFTSVSALDTLLLSFFGVPSASSWWTGAAECLFPGVAVLLFMSHAIAPPL